MPKIFLQAICFPTAQQFALLSTSLRLIFLHCILHINNYEKKTRYGVDLKKLQRKMDDLK